MRIELIYIKEQISFRAKTMILNFKNYYYFALFILKF